MKLRLDKYLADMQAGTRSEVRKMIRNGQACVDGGVVRQPGYQVDTQVQKVFLEGKEIPYHEFVYYMLYKPAGVVSAAEDRREKTVLDLIREKKRKDLFPVGRLDKDTVGLLLITNDGMLAHRLLSPSRHVDKVYEALVCGIVTAEDIAAFAAGIDIGDAKPCLPAELQVLERQEKEGKSRIRLTIREGRFHQVKRMFRAVGKEVLFLKRIGMGGLKLDETLGPGGYRQLTEKELETLC